MSLLSHLRERFSIGKTASGALIAGNRLMSPYRDWYILITFLVVLVIGLLSINAYFFLGVSSGDLVLSESGTQVKSADRLDRNLLRETLLFFEGEAQEFATLKTTAPQVPAPF